MTKRTKKPDDAADAPRAPETTDTALERAPEVVSTALLDRISAALNVLRGALRKGEAVDVPPLLMAALPAEAVAGDRVLLDKWRAWEVWGTFDGGMWTVEIYQDGKLRA